MRVLIFGDSIAYGEYDSQGGWATRLYLEYLNRQAAGTAGDHPFIYNLSIDGETIRGVIERLPHETEGRHRSGEEFAFVIAIGINDSRRLKNGEYASTPEQYAKDLRTLYELMQQYGKKVLFIGLTPVDDAVFENGKFETARIAQFDQVLQDFVQEKGLPFVPMLREFREKLEAGEPLFVDGLHPNDAGHRIMYERIKPALADLLA